MLTHSAYFVIRCITKYISTQPRCVDVGFSSGTGNFFSKVNQPFPARGVTLMSMSTEGSPSSTRKSDTTSSASAIYGHNTDITHALRSAPAIETTLRSLGPRINHPPKKNIPNSTSSTSFQLRQTRPVTICCSRLPRQYTAGEGNSDGRGAEATSLTMSKQSFSNVVTLSANRSTADPNLSSLNSHRLSCSTPKPPHRRQGRTGLSRTRRRAWI